jgi:hypothetical protein
LDTRGSLFLRAGINAAPRNPSKLRRFFTRLRERD